MLTLPPSVRIYVSTEPTDARKSFNALSALVDAHFGHDPLAGHMYVFLNRRGDIAQMLFWDRTGYCIIKKRLEAGTFRLTRSAADKRAHMEVDAIDLALMLEGIDLRGAHRRKRLRLAPSA